MEAKQMYSGQYYRNDCTNLLIMSEPNKNSIQCKCMLCGDVDTYKVSDLKNGTIIGCKKCKQGVNIGDTFGSLTITKFVIRNNAFGAYAKCNKCGKTFAHTINQIKSKGYDCPCCGKKQTVKKDVPKKIVAKTDKQVKKSLVGYVSNFDSEPELNLSKYTVMGDFIFVGTRAKRSATGAKVTFLERGECRYCGATTVDSKANFSKNEYKCKKCNIINSDKRNIIYNTNWVGYVRHNIEIVKTKKSSDGVLMADTRCLACGHEMTIPVVTVVNEPELTCLKCGDTPVKMICPICKKPHIKSTLRKLYEQREDQLKYMCTTTNETVPASEIVMQHEITTRLDNIRKRYKGYTLKERVPGRDGSPDIFKFEEHYTGTDGEIYHTCMCSVHNKLMVLTDDEIANYKHEFCAEARMIPYKPKK